jgi:hypothetical protein
VQQPKDGAHGVEVIDIGAGRDKGEIRSRSDGLDLVVNARGTVHDGEVVLRFQGRGPNRNAVSGHLKESGVGRRVADVFGSPVPPSCRTTLGIQINESDTEPVGDGSGGEFAARCCCPGSAF